MACAGALVDSNRWKGTQRASVLDGWNETNGIIHSIALSKAFDRPFVKDEEVR